MTGDQVYYPYPNYYYFPSYTYQDKEYIKILENRIKELEDRIKELHDIYTYGSDITPKPYTLNNYVYV